MASPSPKKIARLLKNDLKSENFLSIARFDGNGKYFCSKIDCGGIDEGMGKAIAVSSCVKNFT